MRQYNTTRRAFALRVQHAMPGRSVWRAVHHETDGPRRVTFAEQLSDLAICHNPTGRNAPDDCINAFTVLWVLSFCHSSVRSTARAGAPSPLLLLKRNGRQISSYLPAGISLRF